MNNATAKMTADRIRALREKLGLSQLQLSTRLKIAPARISHYETGRRPFPVDVAVRLAKLGKVSLEHFYTKEGV